MRISTTKRLPLELRTENLCLNYRDVSIVDRTGFPHSYRYRGGSVDSLSRWIHGRKRSGRAA